MAHEYGKKMDKPMMNGASCTTISMPKSNEKDVTERGPMPPEGKPPRTKITPWAPKGRKK